MSQFNYTKKPNWYGSGVVAASPKGWVHSPTGEILVAYRDFSSKNTDAVGAPTWTLTLPANGTYDSDDEIVLTLVPSEAVFVVGSPYIEVTIGASVKQFVFDEDTSTPTSLKFTYTVVPGDTDGNGITVANTVTKGTGKLYDVVGDGQVEIAGAITYSVGSTAGILVAGV